MKARNPIFIHYVHDMRRARQFYETVFGVSPSFASRGWTTLDFGSFELALHILPPALTRDAQGCPVPGADAPRSGLAAGHVDEAPLPHAGLNLEVDSIEDLKAAIELAGGQMTELREPQGNVPDRVATFQDPEGNGFELRQHMPAKR